MVIQVTRVQTIIPRHEGWECSFGPLWVIDGRISRRSPDRCSDRIIDAGGAVALPGMVNAHHHMYSALAKGLPITRPIRDFPEILQHLWWTLDRALDAESVLLSAILALADGIRCGVTTVFDHHSSPNCAHGILDLMAEAFQALGVRGALCLEISGRNGDRIFRDSLAESLRFTGNAFVKPMLGLHAGFTLSDDQLDQVARTIPNLPVHIHVAEHPIDVRYAREQGAGVIERLERHGLLRDQSLLIHGNYLEPDDFERLSGRPIRLVQNIESALNNAVEPLDPARLHECHIRSVAGTDGMTGDMFKTHKAGFLRLRGLRGDPTAGFEEIMSQLRESWALKTDWGFGCGLENGEEADFVLTDYRPGVEITPRTWPGHFLYGVTESRARTVFRGQRLLLDEYRLTGDPFAHIFDVREHIVEALHERFERLDRKGART
jgi:cytosine/adenosine deaminase-related metal-dependent hydrolase